MRIDLITTITRALNAPRDVGAILRTATIGDQALVDILAALSVSRIPGVTRTRKPGICVGAGRVRVAIVRIGPALIYVTAIDAVSAVARAARAGERTHSVRARGVAMAVVGALLALVKILATDPIAAVAGVTSAGE